METILLKSSARFQMIDVTAQVNKIVSGNSINEGFCLIFSPHTTTAVTISENTDSNVIIDTITALEKLVPREGGYHHSEGNSQAHILSSIIGSSLYLPIKGGTLMLGQWQGVMFLEMDGPRTRKLHVKLSEG
jgi:secondary thiamine-phosphate synthase enzyme